MQLCMIQKNMESPLSCFVYTAFLRDAGNCLYPIPSNSMYIAKKTTLPYPPPFFFFFNPNWSGVTLLIARL